MKTQDKIRIYNSITQNSGCVRHEYMSVNDLLRQPGAQVIKMTDEGAEEAWPDDDCKVKMCGFFTGNGKRRIPFWLYKQPIPTSDDEPAYISFGSSDFKLK
jgi:hypothetical protein